MRQSLLSVVTALLPAAIMSHEPEGLRARPHVPDRTASRFADCDSTRTLRVLFIGNSLTYVQNVPRLVEGIAAELPGPCIETSMIASGGASLEGHWASRDSVARRIREGRWTHVVLNDQSALGEVWFLEGTLRVGTSGSVLAKFGRLFADVIRESGAKPVLIAHWTRDGAPERDQQALDYIFANFARDAGAELIPVGPALKRMRSELPALTPYHGDGHHLSAAGAYLEALVVYSTLAARSPLGAPRRITGPAVELSRGIVFADSIVLLADLPATEATAIQRIAGATAGRYRGRIPAVPAPKPLSAELPRIPENRGHFDRGDLFGVWRGMSKALPNPGGELVQIEITLNGRGTAAGLSDSLHLRAAGAASWAGPATLQIEEHHVKISSSVMPVSARQRGRQLPMEVELVAGLRNGVMIGNAVIRQQNPGSVSSFNGIGRFRARREAGPAPQPQP